MVEVPLNSITAVVPGSVQGLPVLSVKSTATNSKLVIYTLGLDKNAAHGQLASLAGSENELTKAFADDGA
jgi:hypothetical protein